MRRTIGGWLLVLGALAGAGLGGWFAGTDIVAPQPSEQDIVVAENVVAGRLQVDIDEAAHPNEGLVLGASGLSPFGNQEGLQGRQVLTGRVISVSGGKLVIDSPTGRAEIRLTDETSFLLRMELVDPSAIGSGAAVTIVLDDDGETALSAIALPAESRPTLNTPDPPARPGG
ncbi:MAG: hypothetical protein OXN86_09360 [Chloroflexota bacterium]|nr:hypothetical protein [Chloroflexota bacterium]